jgi:hypothetical protein
MCAMMQKLRMNAGSVFAGSRRRVARGDKIDLCCSGKGTVTTVYLFSHTGCGSPRDLLAENAIELIELEADTDDKLIQTPKSFEYVPRDCNGSVQTKKVKHGKHQVTDQAHWHQPKGC